MTMTLSGDGSITGLVAGGLPDATITPDELTQKLTLGTAIATTSGTSHDFTGIPSWVKRITVMLNGVSTNGTSAHLIQVGSGSISTTGYASQTGQNGTGSGSGVGTVGLQLDAATYASGQLVAIVTLVLVSANQWVAHWVGTPIETTSTGPVGAGRTPALGGALDRIRITTVNGTDTFDAGTFNILYE